MNYLWIVEVHISKGYWSPVGSFTTNRYTARIDRGIYQRHNPDAHYRIRKYIRDEASRG